MKGERERHRAEKIAFRQGFGAVIEMTSGREMADGMYKERDSKKAVGVAGL